jgi:hypothetical protein
MAEDENESRGFKVEDRRRFSASGDAREGVEESAAETRFETPRDSAPTAPPPPAEGPDSAGPFEEMTFSTFVIGLATQALVLLGEASDPEHRLAPDLVGAKQLIDIIGILQAKTKGNLEPAESNLLEAMLYDLRMKYVQRSRSK